MSVPVSLEELRRRVDEYGTVPFLVTTDGAHPHVVSVRITFDGTQLSVEAGRQSRANIDATDTATLLWPDRDGPYCLIVDGDAANDGQTTHVRPTRAVLHRLADASTDLPSCVRIEAEQPH
jgi:hypothetical protein